MEPTYVHCRDIREGLRRLMPFAELLAREYPGRPSDAAAWFLRRVLADAATVQAVVSRGQ